MRCTHLFRNGPTILKPDDEVDAGSSMRTHIAVAKPASAYLFRNGPAILKPDDGTQGDGIYLVSSKEEALRRMQMQV